MSKALEFVLSVRLPLPEYTCEAGALQLCWGLGTDTPPTGGHHQPIKNKKCPTSVSAQEGQRYDENNRYSSKDLTWAWHSLNAPPYAGFAANSIVEVSHQKDPFGDEHSGMWFVYGRGSGVFFDIGNTVVFSEHEDAYSFFKVPKKGDRNEQMSQKAAAAGYDSVQFIRHVDGTNYPCAKDIGAAWMNMEIVAVKLVGTYACGQAAGTAASLRAGWKGTKPCKCDPSNPNTNCVFTDLDADEPPAGQGVRNYNVIS